MVIDAAKAKQKAEKNKEMSKTLLRVLKAIDERCEIGELYLEWDDSKYPNELSTKDVKFLRGLGFVVSHGKWETWEHSHGRESSHYRPTKISWDK